MRALTLATLTTLFSFHALGQGSTNLGMTTAQSNQAYYGWNIEGTLQYISMADSADSMIGSGLFYELTRYFDVGIQTLLSTNEGGNSVTRILGRQYLTAGRTNLFFQPAVAYNLHNHKDTDVMVESGSVSAEIGLKHRLVKDVTIGGTSGLELIDKGRYYKKSTIDREYALTPRIAMMANVVF